MAAIGWRTARIAGTMLVLGMMLASSASAQAGPVFSAAHVPPPAAVAGEDMDVRIAVTSSCVYLCGPITTTVHYLAPNGTWTSISSETTHQPLGTVTLRIPGEDVRAPSLTYRIRASQWDCLDGCHQSAARMPSSKGSFTVMVVEQG